MSSFVGIDFGTTNSAIGYSESGAAPQLLPFPGAGAPTPTWRTILHFAPSGGVDGPHITAGSHAIARYLDSGGEGRLIQSVKSYLSSALFKRTLIFDRTWTLEELIGAFLSCMRRAAPVDLGRRAVVGRPVRYWGAECDDDETRAVSRMRAALAIAGFDDVVFEFEPVAAAAHYAARLDHAELVLIADFGGGTSDFSLIRVGPGVPGDASAVLATGGVGIGGDTFDARVIDHVVAPMLGKGTAYRDELGGEMTVPAWLFSRLRRWHHLSFLNTPKTLHLLHRIETGARDPGRIANLIHVIEHDLGLPMHQSIEATKVALSSDDEATLRFVNDPIALVAYVYRTDLDRWITDELDTIDAVVTDVLARAGVTSAAVDRVFATGGSSLVPAIRGRLGRRFGADRVVGGEELTSVAWGLAARAAAHFG